MSVERKLPAPKINANMADNNGKIDDVAVVLTIIALLADEKRMA